jgi:monoterpene epsilon-lactone hydrolase
VDARLDLYPVATHVFHLFWSFLPEAAEAIDNVSRFIADTGGASAPRATLTG